MRNFLPTYNTQEINHFWGSNKDHLGNTRVSFRDNGSGSAELIQEDAYYPFGMTLGGLSYVSGQSASTNKYKFQGQELQDDHDLGWYQFKWRMHDPAIGRFTTIDPLSEKYVHNSPYAFSENKVVAHIELEGLESVRISKETLFKAATTDKVTKASQEASKAGAKIATGHIGAQGYGVGGKLKLGNVKIGGKVKLVTGKVESAGNSEYSVQGSGLTAEGEAKVGKFGVSGEANLGSGEVTFSGEKTTSNIDVAKVSGEANVSSLSATTEGDVEVGGSAVIGNVDVGGSINFTAVVEYIEESVEAIQAFFEEVITYETKNAFNTDSQGRTQEEFIREEF